MSIFAGIRWCSNGPTEGSALSSCIASNAGIATDSIGNLYIADDHNSIIEKITPSGILSVVAGHCISSGTGNPLNCRTSNGNPTIGPALSSMLNVPYGVTVDNNGNIYIADTGNSVIEKVDTSGNLSIFAGYCTSNGAGQPLSCQNSGYPTVGAALLSNLSEPHDVAVDSLGNVYIADTDNGVVEKVDTNNNLIVYAGFEFAWGGPIPGLANQSPVGEPVSLAIDPLNNLYVADVYNSVVYIISPSGYLDLFVGECTLSGAQYSCSNSAAIPGPANLSPLWSPTGLSIDALGNLYISDSENSYVYIVN